MEEESAQGDAGLESETRGSQTRESRRGNSRRGDHRRESRVAGIADAGITDAGVASRDQQTQESQTRGSRCVGAPNARFETRVRKQTERRKGDSFAAPDEGKFGPNPKGGYRP